MYLESVFSNCQLRNAFNVYNQKRVIRSVVGFRGVFVVVVVAVDDNEVVFDVVVVCGGSGGARGA